jgi:hypothetical protein
LGIALLLDNILLHNKNSKKSVQINEQELSNVQAKAKAEYILQK